MKRAAAVAGSAAIALTMTLSGALALAVPAGATSKGAIKKDIKKLLKEIKGSNHATFKAQYSINTSGKTETLTFEQAPPKSLIGTSSGSVINTGKTTYFCSSSSGSQTCVSQSGGVNPLASLLDLISPSTVQKYLQTAEAQAAVKHSGYSLKFFNGKYAGQSSKCVTGTGHGESGTYCVNGAGILDYLGSASTTITLTSYSSHPPASDFAPPAGATVETIPAGVSIP